MEDLTQLQRRLNCLAASRLPPSAWESSVPIVIAMGDTVRHLGTGTLFRIASSSFLVTAGHVFKKASELKKTIGIGGAVDGRFVSLADGETVVTTEGQYGVSHDPLDIGLHRLNSVAKERFGSHRFLCLDEMDFAPQTSTGIYTLLGYPAVWSSPSRSEDEKVSYRALEYTACEYDRDASGLERYQEKLHLLINGQIDQTTDVEAAQVEFNDIQGRPMDFPRGLNGISGCSVWRIGDSAIPADQWGDQKARLVAVQTGAYHQAQAIQATRWIAVSTMIYHAFPELRAAMMLWRAS